MICIQNVHVYAPEDLGVCDILIVNDKIAEIGPNLSLFLPEKTEVIDGTGKIAIPGLIDQHVHITGGGGESGFASKIHEITMSECVSNGVTSVVGLLGTDSVTRSVENLVSKVKGLRQEGMSAWCLTGGYEYPSVNICGSVSRDISFIEEVLGVKLAISDHRCSYPTVEELIRLTSQVRIASLLAKKPGVVHLHTGRGKAGLTDILEVLDRTDIPVWHFRPTHITHQPGADEFAARGGYIDVTTGADTEERQEDILYWMEHAQPEHLTLSSDANGSMPIWGEDKELIGMGVSSVSSLFRTVRALIWTHHIPVEQALAPVTANVAKALNLYPRKGHLAAGSDADVILMNEDWQIEQVYAMGKTDWKDFYSLAK